MASAKELQQLVADFPAVYARAVEDWAKFKAAVDAGTVPASTQRAVSAWFYDFPRLWLGIAPNWTETVNGIAPTADKLAFADQVGRFVVRLRGEPLMQQQNGLGLAFLVIAGIAIAAAFGIAGVTWAVGYVLEQRNVSAMIDGVTAGKIPPDILRKAVNEEKQSLLGGIGSGLAGVLAPVALIAALVFVAPKVFKGR